ncbi:MAG TPA: UbiA-like polyprenyltransferase [Acidobacteriaceae bacterium]|nr:UbiA-like polyprenyltransferase [Acidobacteriaceae bacterium]
MKFLQNTRTTLEMIKWEHSIFALPFALTGAMLAAHGLPAWHVLGWIVVCMIAARSAAMAFNRLVDARFDANNARTAMRAIPAGLLSRSYTLGFITVASVVFVFSASRLNHLTLLLSPLALAIVFFYSLTKRFTRWSHIFLGISLGVAPAAAWIAVRGSLDPRILVLTAAVVLWVAAFDTLYACQDIEYDRQAGLNSIPQAHGAVVAFWMARLMHVFMILLLVWLSILFGLGKLAIAGIAAVALLLAYEHLLVSPKDLRRLNAAFFTMNGIISVVFFLFIAADLLWK